eukprot:34268-Eustigmatos_ZCMA.PRE.1
MGACHDPNTDSSSGRGSSVRGGPVVTKALAVSSVGGEAGEGRLVVAYQTWPSCGEQGES